MNLLLRLVFFGMAAFLVVYVVMFANYLHLMGEPLLRAKTIWVGLAGAFFFVIAGWRFSLKNKFKIFAVLFSLLTLELFLQAAAWLGVLPGVNTKIKAPYARVYWTGEGHGNSIRNRFGWYFQEFNLKTSRRIAVIGDSLVEAVEVGRDKNEAAVLQQLLRAQSPEWSVLGLGSHGTCPAYHLDVIDYACRHFAVDEAIVVIYLGNDVSDSSPALTYVPPKSYIYYDLDSSGQLVLSPANAANRERFIHSMEASHCSLWVLFPLIFNSHCMILQSLLSIRDHAEIAQRLKTIEKDNPKAFDLGRLGTDARQFAKTPGPEARHAMDVMMAEMALIEQKCETNHVKLRLVTVPLFPPQFYAEQSGTNWTLQFGDYDFLVTDRELATFSKSHNIPYLSFADWLAARKTDVHEIQKLYFFDGSGHFTERGHQLCAEAMQETFYPNPTH